MIRRFIKRLRFWPMVAFTVLAAANQQCVALLSSSDSAVAEIAMKVLAAIPGLLFLFLALRVLRPPKSDPT